MAAGGLNAFNVPKYGSGGGIGGGGIGGGIGGGGIGGGGPFGGSGMGGGGMEKIGSSSGQRSDSRGNFGGRHKF